MSDKPDNIITPEFRGSYCNLVTPRVPGRKSAKQDPDKKPKYGMLIVLPKDDSETKKFIARLKAAIDAVCVAKFGKPIPHNKLKDFPIRSGDDDENEDFAGHILIPASNTFKPNIIDEHGQKLFDEESLYSGAWYRAGIYPWAWDHELSGKGVSINLNTVLKVRDDEAFTSKANAEDDFRDYLKDTGESPKKSRKDLDDY